MMNVRWGGGGEGTDQPQPNPRLGQVYQQAILRPPPRRSNLLHGEVVSVLLEMDLHDESDGIHYT